ncbi:MAG TPA: EamA family transporter, partial [Rubrivivax sp.]|nr:EamA family transporter [Rubrivivax sp.]
MTAAGASLALPAARIAVLPVLALVFNAFTWGVSWWPFRQLEALGLHPLWATAL